MILGLDAIKSFKLEQKTDLKLYQEGMELQIQKREMALNNITSDKLLSIVNKYNSVFEGLGFNDRIKHKIILTDKTVVRQKQRHVPLPLLADIKKQIEEMEKLDIIEKSKSEYRSNIVPVKKPDGTTRITIDYRDVNKISKADSFPIPRIDDILVRLRNAKIFSKLDLVKGYYQIPLDKESREVTAFSCDRQLHQFKRMPMGLKTAPQTFQRLMELIFGNIGFVDFYLDDLIIFSKTEEEHLQHVATVLQIIKDENLKLNKKKCIFGARDIEYLGFAIGENRRSPTSINKQKLLKFPTPSNQKEVKAFIASANFYRKLINKFAHTAKPLYDCMSNKKFEWTPECDDSFKKIKELIEQEPKAAIPDPDAKFIVTTDASDIGMGGVLEQEVDGKREVVEFYSKTFTECQRRYSTYEKEATAILAAVEHWKHFLIGRPFRIETDHKPLCWLLSKRDCLGKLGRMVARLDEFQIENIEHIKGKDNDIADALSRIQLNLLIASTENDDELIRMSRRDPDNFERIGDKLFFVERCSLLNRNIHRLCIASAEDKKRILQECHDNMGHFGEFKCIEHIKKRFYWPGWKRDVKNHIRICSKCAQFKSDVEPIRLPMITNETTELRNWETLGLDVVGPLATTPRENKYIIVAQDYYSKFLITMAAPIVNTQSVTRWLDDIFTEHGRPKRIITDNGPQFTSRDFKQWARDNNIDISYATPFHHQTNGMVERANRTIETMLRTTTTNQTEWDTLLPDMTRAYNTATHHTTALSPHKLHFGVEARSELDREFGITHQRDDTRC